MSQDSRGGSGVDQQHRNLDDDVIEIVEERGRPGGSNRWRPDENSRRPDGGGGGQRMEEEDDLWSEALAGDGLSAGRSGGREADR